MFSGLSCRRGLEPRDWAEHQGDVFHAVLSVVTVAAIQRMRVFGLVVPFVLSASQT